MVGRPFLDYYASNKIIPVRQDVTDLCAHLRRRSLLYHYLHIPPGAVRGRRVLEIGPGTGDNAIHVAALQPDFYVLIDGNPYSISAVKEKFKDDRYQFGAIRHLECIESDLLTYNDSNLYDLVICEGVIPGQANPKLFLQRAASFVIQGGLLMVTTHSAISMLAEVCRRLLKPIFAKRTTPPEDLCNELTTFLAPHLKTLPGRSRLAEDWVRDNILHPWPERVFTIQDTIDAIGDQFDVYGTSPQFIHDFRWYKAAAVDQFTINDVARAQAEKWSSLFIDYRLSPDKCPILEGIDLEAECRHVFHDAHSAWMTDDFVMVAACVDRIEVIGSKISSVFPQTAESIRDFVLGTRALMDGQPSGFSSFKSWFGRGQQYVSLLRNYLKDL
jgi:ubiquinone/menaquinone biosynthesis C-methylase UbiE